MSYYVLYNQQSGNLIDISSVEFAPERMEAQLVLQSRSEEMPDLLKVVWNSSILDFQTRQVRELSKLQFLSKFTMQERIAARASTDPVMDDIMTMLDLAEFIDLDDVATVQAVGYMTATGIISSDRAEEILN